MEKQCVYCKRNISDGASDDDLISDYGEQADALGMESLTELQQMLVDGNICEECYCENT